MRRSSYVVVAAAGLLAATAFGAYADDIGTSSGDAQITELVKNKLAANDAEVAPRIEVDTKDGVVTLRGEAMSAALMEQALMDAKSVQGVVKVRNRLRFN